MRESELARYWNWSGPELRLRPMAGGGGGEP